MKRKLKFIYIISLLTPLFLSAQVDTTSTVYKQRYGLRIGIDISKLIRKTLDKNYFGAEAVADYRINYSYYAAAEAGFERKTTETDFFKFKTTGSFLKFGVDYNTYGNWYGMENMIYAGGRYATSLFEQDLESYSINNRNNEYWEEPLEGKNPDILGEYSGRMAHWIELLIGMKVELFHNLYAGLDIRLKKMIYNKPSGFPNYWIPGFGRVWENGTIGVGYNYTITYLIPFYRKKPPKQEKDKK